MIQMNELDEGKDGNKNEGSPDEYNNNDPSPKVDNKDTESQSQGKITSPNNTTARLKMEIIL